MRILFGFFDVDVLDDVLNLLFNKGFIEVLKLKEFKCEMNLLVSEVVFFRNLS